MTSEIDSRLAGASSGPSMALLGQMRSNRHPRLRLAAALVATLAAALIGLGAGADASFAAACDAPVTNPIACENTKPGADPSTWQIDGAGDPTIQGFATPMSVNKGQTIAFKIKSATAELPDRHPAARLLRRQGRARGRRAT